MSESAGGRALVWLQTDPRRSDLAVAVATMAIATLLIAGASERFDTGWPEVVAGVGAFVLLLGRRHIPFPLLAVAFIWTAVHVLVWDRPTPMIFAMVVLLGTACVRLERWPAIGLGAAIGVSLYVMGFVTNDAELGDARAVIGIAWAASAVGIADAIRSWRRYRESSEAQLRATVVAAEARSRQQVSDERLAIARELHDLLAHNLSVMNVHTGAALHLLRADPDQAEQSLTAARDAGRGVLDELSEMVGVLRNDETATAAPTSSLPTVERLPALIETVRSAGLDVAWTRSGQPRVLAPAVSLAAYRIAQEALTNAAKHGTGSADVTTVWDDRGFSLVVSNRIGSGGSTGDSAGGGHGLIGMRERASANGGELRAEAEGHEFVVRALLPSTAAGAADETVVS